MTRNDRKTAMQRGTPIRVAVIEDTATFREEVCKILEESTATRLAGSYATVKGSMRGLSQHAVDVAIVDLELLDGSGVEVIEWLKNHQPEVDCLVLTHFSDEKHLFAALEAGAVGYILKDEIEKPELIQSIQDVIDGGSPMSNSVARGILQHFRNRRETRTPTAAPDPNLTNRELEILDLLSNGFVTKRVAAELGIAYETVRCHQKRIYKKLHARSAVQAINIWKKGTSH